MSIVTYNNRSIRDITAIPGAAKSLTHIKTLTASSDANVDFDHGSSDVVLDSTYPIYIVKFISVHPASVSQFQFQANGAGETGFNETITSTSFQSFHREDDSSTSLNYRTGDDQAQGTSYQTLTNNVGDDADQGFAGTLYLFNPSSTTFVKHFMSTTNQYDRADISVNPRMAGYGNTTSSIDAVRFQMSSGNIESGVIKLYGIS